MAASASSRQHPEIFFAKELSARAAKRLPLSEQLLGFYCNAGIEPSEFDENDVAGRTNQDKAFIAGPLYPRDTGDANVKEWICAGVLDGLGLHGEVISEFCASQLVSALQDHPMRITKPSAALKDAFFKTDDAMRRHDELKISAVSSGCTACVAVLHRYSLYLAQLGDTGAVLGKRRTIVGGEDASGVKSYSVVAKKLTREHTPTNLVERARCLSKGAHVSPESEPGLADARVWRNPEMTELGLTVSRSLGHHGARSIGVTAEAEVREILLTPEDIFLIIGTDGLWQYMDPQEACEVVYSEMEHEDGTAGRSTANGGGGGRFASRAAARLMEIAISRWREEEDDFRDDISVVVLSLPVTHEEDNSAGPSLFRGEIKSAFSGRSVARKKVVSVREAKSTQAGTQHPGRSEDTLKFAAGAFISKGK
mmetsp:Transcript_25235/g.51879  ORF Transcript_25235/g.51879 Transcript_25235/m.51879 type:complete len:424 (-) Transcript_25235:85-1356(-)